ncbi:unnamed protein product [Prorocentrum cordatum]|nr:unnamed protein product [Polarella glacialis]
MQRGNAWYCTFLAAARLQVPVVALSRDLPDRGAELKRNAEILESHRPALVVVDEVAGVPTHAGATVHFRELWAAAHAESHPAPQVTATADAILCYNYTGGTTRASRCSRITHRMALHEVTHYPRVGELTPRDRVLQQHSLYWGASAFGEIDIALAFGCALVFCEAWGTDDVVSVIKKHSATCAGLVPSMLAAIEHADVPTLKLVFTWGEALQPVVAREWGRRVHLIDLLISTECWLSLYADWSRGCAGGSAPYAGPSGSVGRAALEPPRPAFRTVPGTRVRLRRVDEDGCGRSQSSSSSAQASVRTEPREAERGELLVAGPMVSPGYTDEVLNADAFEEDSSGVRWYCTKDCVERRDGGLAFVGRADDLVKVGGKWTDIRELEARLLAMEEVSEASICGRSAFVALRGMPSGLMPRLQAVLPQDFALFLVPKLPRSAATSKVDRQRLGLLLPSGPTEGRAQAEGRRCEEELASMLHWYWPLSLVAGGSLLRAGLGLPPACLLAGPDGGVLAGVLRTLAVRALGELSWRLPCLTRWRTVAVVVPGRLDRGPQRLPARGARRGHPGLHRRADPDVGHRAGSAGHGAGGTPRPPAVLAAGERCRFPLLGARLRLLVEGAELVRTWEALCLDGLEEGGRAQVRKGQARERCVRLQKGQGMGCGPPGADTRVHVVQEDDLQKGWPRQSESGQELVLQRLLGEVAQVLEAVRPVPGLGVQRTAPRGHERLGGGLLLPLRALRRAAPRGGRRG